MLYIKKKAKLSTIMSHLLVCVDQVNYDYIMREIFDVIIDNHWQDKVMKRLEELYEGEIYDDKNDWICVLEDIAETVEELYGEAAYEEEWAYIQGERAFQN